MRRRALGIDQRARVVRRSLISFSSGKAGLYTLPSASFEICCPLLILWTDSLLWELAEIFQYVDGIRYFIVFTGGLAWMYKTCEEK